MSADPEDVSDLLRRMRDGSTDAKQKLAEVVYTELRKIAAVKMRAERLNHTLTPTALANEAWLRFADLSGGFANRDHFFAAASNAMRRVLIDHARARGASKRDAGRQVDIEKVDIAAPESDEQLLALDHALEELSKVDPRAASVVEMRYFGGLTHQQIATILDVDRRTVDRDWSLARAWLLERLSSGA
jgi:RNA polymerase sigma-70 factor (ECF subfamily)